MMNPRLIGNAVTVDHRKVSFLLAQSIMDSINYGYMKPLILDMLSKELTQRSAEQLNKKLLYVLKTYY